MANIANSGDIRTIQLQKAEKLFQKRLEELRLSEEDLKVILPDGQEAMLFECANGVRGNAIQINYLTELGGKERFKKESSRFINNFKRYRLIEPNGTQKYTQEKKSGQVAFLSSIYQDYWSKGSQTPHIIATEGEFKSVALSKAGVPAVAVPGIFGFGSAVRDKITNKKIDVKLIRSLESAINEKSVQTITFLFDGDQRDPGDVSSDYFYYASQHFLLSVQHLNGVQPRIAFQKPVLVGGEYPKGVDDLIYHSRGTALEAEVDEAIELLQRGESSHFFDVFLSGLAESHKDAVREVAEYLGVNKKPLAPSIEPTELRVKQYLSECAGELDTLIETHSDICIGAPTGSGKTGGILEELIPSHILSADPTALSVMLAPTNAIVDNQYNSNLKNEAQGGGSYKEATESTELLRIDGSVSKDQLIPLNTYAPGVASTVMSTYDGLQKIERVIDYLFIDESHRISADAEFRRRALIDLEKHLFGCKRNDNGARILMSAQPSPFFKYFGFEFVKVVPEKINVKDVIVREYTTSTDNVIGKLTNKIASRVREDADSLYAVRVEHKETLDVIKRTLIKLGLNKEQILVATSDNKEDLAFKDMLSSNRVPDRVNVLLSTSVIDEGVNIKGKRLRGAFFFPDKCGGVVSATPAIQYLNRFRDIEGSEAELSVYVKKDERSGENYIHPEDLVYKMKKLAKTACDWQNARHILGSNDEESSLVDKKMQNLIYWCDRSNSWLPFNLGIIRECEVYYSKKRSPAQFIADIKEDRTFNVIVEEYDPRNLSSAFASTKKEIKLERASFNELLDASLLMNPAEVMRLFMVRIESDKRKFITRSLKAFIVDPRLNEFAQPLVVTLPTLSKLSSPVKQRAERTLKEILRLYDTGQDPYEAVELVLGLKKERKARYLDLARASLIMQKNTIDAQGNYDPVATEKKLSNTSKTDTTITLAYHKLRGRLIELSKHSSEYYNRHFRKREIIALARGKHLPGAEFRQIIGMLSDEQIWTAVNYYCKLNERKATKQRLYKIEQVYSIEQADRLWYEIARKATVKVWNNNSSITDENSLRLDNKCTPLSSKRKILQGAVT